MDKVSATPVPPVLETPTMNITAAQNWMPNLATPSLKLPTPVLDSGDWGNAAGISSSASGAGGLLSAGPGGLGSGMSPRFMLESLRMSPGVSGSIAPNASAHAPRASSSSLAELFICNEYSNPQNNSASVGNTNNPSNATNNDNPPSSSNNLGPSPNNGATSNTNKNPQNSTSMAMPTPGLTVNVSQAQPQAHQPKQSMQQQHLSLPQAIPPQLSVPVSAPQESALPVHSAAGALRSMHAAPSRPLNIIPPQHPMPPNNSAIPHQSTGLGIGYPHPRSLPMSQMQPSIPQQQARYPDMGNNYAAAAPAMPPSLGVTPHQAAQRLSMHPQNSNNTTMAAMGMGSIPSMGTTNTMAPPTRMRAGGTGGGMVSSAIEEAKQNAQERADKFAQKRKRSRLQANSNNDKGNNDGSGSEDNGGNNSNNNDGGDLKKKRYNRRLELNRQSAAVSRVRRRAYVEELEGKLMCVEREKLNLEDQVTVMNNETAKLRQQVRALHEQLSNPASRVPANNNNDNNRSTRNNNNNNRSTRNNNNTPGNGQGNQ